MSVAIFERQKSLLQTKVERKIERIPREAWNGIFPSRHEGYAFYKTLDEAHFEQFSFYYITVYQDGLMVGAAPCFLMDYPLEATVQGPLKSLIGWIKKIFPNLLNLRALICGLPMGQGRVGIREGADAAAVLDQIVQTMEQIAREERVSILAFKDFNQTFVSLLEPLVKRGFSKIENFPSTAMGLNFSDFDGYLKTLSRVSRDGLKRKFKKIDAQGSLTFEITSALRGEDLRAVYDLFLQTARQSDLQFEKVPEAFFQKISENMPEEAKYFLWRIDRKIVAFALCLASGDDFIDYYLGFDYALAHDYHLYFLRFRDLMKWCLDHHMKTYEMGTTSYEPKRRLGFDFIPLFIYAKHLNRWASPFFRLLCAIVKPENFDPVFQEMKKKPPR